MNIKLDLHIHSERSFDGVMALDEITKLAKARGLDGVAICDHDLACTNAPEADGFLVIPGIEVSTQFGHLLGLFVTCDIADRDFFRAAEEIHARGGLAVLAHPFEHSRDAERLLPLVPYLDGVEVWNARANRNNKNANAAARKFAETHGLRFFAGSDAHVPAEIGGGVLSIDAAELTPAAVKEALLHGEVTASGVRAKSRFVAESQLTKLKKAHAGLPAYLKWALFALKCLAQDLIA